MPDEHKPPPPYRLRGFWIFLLMLLPIMAGRAHGAVVALLEAETLDAPDAYAAARVPTRTPETEPSVA